MQGWGCEIKYLVSLGNHWLEISGHTAKKDKDIDHKTPYPLLPSYQTPLHLSGAKRQSWLNHFFSDSRQHIEQKYPPE